MELLQLLAVVGELSIGALLVFVEEFEKLKEIFSVFLEGLMVAGGFLVQ